MVEMTQFPLTPEGIAAAQAAAQITDESVFPGVLSTPAYSAYMHVSSEVSPHGNPIESFMAFTYWTRSNGLPADETTPLFLWTSGGPGCSASIGNFQELGPYRLPDQQESFVRNPYAWSNDAAEALFIDNPVGAGYSYTTGASGYARTETDVAGNVALFLEKFFQYFPEAANRPLYVASESYGGHYAPAITAYLIRNPTPGVNVSGVAWGDGVTDPVHQMTTTSLFAYANNLISRSERDELVSLENRTVAAIEAGDFSAAHKGWGAILEYVESRAQGYWDQYDIRLSSADDNEESVWLTHVMDTLPAVRDALHMGSQEEHPYNYCGTKAFLALMDDTFVSSIPDVNTIVDAGLPCVVYTGNQDLIVPGPSQGEWIWAWAPESFTKAPRAPVTFVDPTTNSERPAFYWQEDQDPARRFAFAEIPQAGHEVPATQPLPAKILFEKLLSM
eukprot:gnl/Ergobibamus_cyprinoides/77.p1 GENE.gnl/Ergobibamus_cyprinoides/77~~gnl/Ergobibamus_cyprinoides/77.p1  ORF type:complete len:469 (+),score=164.59 gnl/Ergobibamus_cyprinoides/77:67-1407(+)